VTVTLHVGTSGWQYPDWRGPVYPPRLAQGRWLEWYAERFSTVESNSAFYRLPERRTFEAWAARTPDDFRWAVKASRYLTHVRRLREPEVSVDRLVERVAGLGAKRGPILLQLPPRFRVDAERLDRTLARFPAGWAVAVEPRDASWAHLEVRAVLEARGAALCLADRLGPLQPTWRTAAWTYLRLHEGRASPRPCYGAAALARWVRHLGREWGPDAEAWVYFNNDARGCAPADALAFGRLARRLGMHVARIAGADAARRAGPDRR
jgi:uncharacterized protein YecE (DUF72 family)